MFRPSRTRRSQDLPGSGWRAFSNGLVPVLVLAFCGQVPMCASDNSDVETRVKVAFIYNFVRFVEWPHATPGPVRIGIVGHGDLAAPLQEFIKGKSVSGRPIEVAQVNGFGEADCCEILLIEHSEIKHLKDIAQALAEKPVLTVCDSDNSLKDGVMIAFQIVDESVRFQINREAAERAGLKISSQLLKVALPQAGKQR